MCILEYIRGIIELDFKNTTERKEYYYHIQQILNELFSLNKSINIEITPQERGSKYRPDLEIKKCEETIGVVEFKRPSENEAHIISFFKYAKKIYRCYWKQMVTNDQNKKNNGVLINCEDFFKFRKDYPNRAGDSIGQVRGYFYFYKDKHYVYNRNPLPYFAILTNGIDWIIFDFKDNLKNSCINPCEKLKQKIEPEEIIDIFELPEDFYQLQDCISNYRL